jgi:hypothetical protein
MLDTLISSKTRVKLLLKFFLNPDNRAYLRGLESEFGESTNAIRIELNRFEEAGMLSSASEGNRKVYQANKNHPLFGDMQSLLRKYVGIDQLIETVLSRLGEVQRVYLVGEFAKGLDSSIIDLVIVGSVNDNYLIELIKKAERLLNKKIRYLVYSGEEFGLEKPLKGELHKLLIWTHEG